MAHVQVAENLQNLYHAESIAYMIVCSGRDIFRVMVHRPRCYFTKIQTDKKNKKNTEIATTTSIVATTATIATKTTHKTLSTKIYNFTFKRCTKYHYTSRNILIVCLILIPV